MHHRVYAFNIVNFVLIFVFFRNVASYRNILKKRALIANNEIMTLRAFLYEGMIIKMMNRTINVYLLVIARDLDLSRIIKSLFDDNY